MTTKQKNDDEFTRVAPLVGRGGQELPRSDNKPLPVAAELTDEYRALYDAVFWRLRAMRKARSSGDFVQQDVNLVNAAHAFVIAVERRKIGQ